MKVLIKKSQDLCPQSILLGTEATPKAHASSSQLKDKCKAPVTEESTEEDDEATEDEDQVDPEQFRLTRRRPGSSKITI